MKRLLAILLLLAAATAAALPVYGGLRAEAAYRRFVAQLDAGPGARAEIVRYRRGWLRSETETRVTLRGGAELELAMAQTIMHGPIAVAEWLEGRVSLEPVLAVIKTEITPNLSRKPALAAALGEAPLVRIRTVVHPSGLGEAELASPPHQRDKDWNEIGIDWQGFDGSFIFTQGFSQVSGALRAPGLDVVGEESTLRLRSLQLELDAETGADGIPYGTWSLEVGGVELTRTHSEDARPLLLRAARYDQSAAREGDRIHLAFTAAFEALRIDGAAYGPGEMRIALRNLDAPSVAQYRALQRATAGDGQDAPPSAVPAAQVQGLLPAMLGQGPELQLERFVVGSPDGELTGSARLALSEQGAALVAMSPMLGLAALEAHAEATIPAAMLHRALDAIVARRLSASKTADTDAGEEAEAARDPAELEREAEAQRLRVVAERTKRVRGWLDANLLVRDGDTYRTRLELREGQVLLNGEPTDAAALAVATQAAAGAR